MQESTSFDREGLKHLHSDVRFLAYAFHRLYIAPRQLPKTHHASSLLVGALTTRWRVPFQGASVFIIGCHRGVVDAMDGVRGRETIQKNTSLVEKVEPLEDVSVCHARRIRYTVLVLVLSHDCLTIEIERRHDDRKDLVTKFCQRQVVCANACGRHRGPSHIYRP